MAVSAALGNLSPLTIRALPLPPLAPQRRPARRPARPRSDRAGGYTRVMRCGFRTGDRAPMAIIEYVAREGEIRPARPGTAQPVAPEPVAAVAPPRRLAAAVKAAAQGAAKATIAKKEELR